MPSFGALYFWFYMLCCWHLVSQNLLLASGYLNCAPDWEGAFRHKLSISESEWLDTVTKACFFSTKVVVSPKKCVVCNSEMEK